MQAQFLGNPERVLANHHRALVVLQKLAHALQALAVLLLIRRLRNENGAHIVDDHGGASGTAMNCCSFSSVS